MKKNTRLTHNTLLLLLLFLEEKHTHTHISYVPKVILWRGNKIILNIYTHKKKKKKTLPGFKSLLSLLVHLNVSLCEKTTVFGKKKKN